MTACTKRKSRPADVSAEALSVGSAASLAEQWCELLEAVSDRLAANRLYSGRGHRLAAKCAADHGAAQLIVSAGLGLVRAEDLIPSYGLTIAPGELDSVLPHLDAPDAVADWWQAIVRLSPFARSLEREWTGSRLLVVALPLRYLKLVAEDLARMSAERRPALRVISAAHPSLLPAVLRPFHLPYDSRLDGPDSNRPGTGSDFLGRAAGHFLALAGDAPDADVSVHRDFVNASFAGFRPRQRAQGRSLPDQDLLAIIRGELQAGNKGSSAMLCRLRRELSVACEQGRFKRLYASVADELLAA